jgi:hypothetical protein
VGESSDFANRTWGYFGYNGLMRRYIDDYEVGFYEMPRPV